MKKLNFILLFAIALYSCEKETDQISTSSTSTSGQTQKMIKVEYTGQTNSNNYSAGAKLYLSDNGSISGDPIQEVNIPFQGYGTFVNLTEDEYIVVGESNGPSVNQPEIVSTPENSISYVTFYY